MDQRIAAVITVTDIVAEFSGLASHNGGSHFQLFHGKERMQFSIIRKKAAEGITDRKNQSES